MTSGADIKGCSKEGVMTSGADLRFYTIPEYQHLQQRYSV